MGLTPVEAFVTSLAIAAWILVALALSRGEFKAISDSADFGVASLLAACCGLLIKFFKKRHPIPSASIIALASLPIGVLIGMTFCIASSSTVCSSLGFKQASPHTDVWVRQIRPDTFAPSALAFSVPLATNDAFNIDHLKAAIIATTHSQVFAIFRHQESSPIEAGETRVDVNSPKTPYRFILSEFWVRYARRTFKVNPATSDVDSLKKAVRPVWEPLEQARLTVKDDKGNVLKASAPLQANTEETAYIVEESES